MVHQILVIGDWVAIYGAPEIGDWVAIHGAPEIGVFTDNGLEFNK